MKKLIIAFCLAFALALAGCTAEKPTSNPTEAMPEAVTLFDTDTCRIVLDGAQTTVADKISGSTYSYTTSKTYSATQSTLEQLQARCIARTSASTDSMEIQIAGGLIIVHDLAGGQVYYIDR